MFGCFGFDLVFFGSSFERAPDFDCISMLAFHAALHGLPPQILDKLQLLGVDRPEVLRFFADGPEDWEEFLLAEFPGVEDMTRSEWAALLAEAGRAAHEPGAKRARLAAGYTPSEVAQHAVRAQRVEEQGRLCHARAARPEANRVAQAPSQGPAARWPGKVRRGAPGAARQSRDLQTRARWVQKAAELVVEAELPVVRLMEYEGHLSAVEAVVGQGRRSRTLQKWVTAWRKARAFFLAAQGTAWPISTSDFLEYLRVRAEEPCRRSALVSAVGALAFLEQGGGVRPEDQLAKDPLVKSTLQELTLRVTQTDPQEVRKAPRIPLALALSWEMTVVDEMRLLYDRLYAFWLLVKLWGTLRFDDHRGMLPSKMHLGLQGLAATLVRTKTSGVGKKVEALPLFISRHAYLLSPRWLEIGLKLWEAEGADRDYFLRRSPCKIAPAPGTTRRPTWMRQP